MSKEIIKSIEINIGDTTVKVSPKQAKELFQALADLLGEQTYKMTVTPAVYPQPWWSTQGITRHGTGDVLSNSTITICGTSGTLSCVDGITNLTNSTTDTVTIQ